MKKGFNFIAIACFLPLITMAATNPYLPYPFIDITKGIPSWINNCNSCNNCNGCNNETKSAPQDKGSYVSSFDNTTQDGKIYYQTYTQTGTGVTIATVPKKVKSNKQSNKQSNTVTYETSVK